MKKSLLKKIIFISALAFSNSVWGFTTTANQSTLNDKFNDSKKSVSWKGNHVTFTLAGNHLYNALGYLYICNEERFLSNKAASYAISWDVVSGYDIEVTKVILDIDRASGGSSYITIEGKKWGDLFWSDNIPDGGIYSGTLSKGNTGNVSIEFSKALSWSTCAVNSITIEYNLKPQINVSDGNVEVTICDGNKKTIDLRTLAKPVVTNGHVSYSYSLESVEPAANTSATTETGHISDYTFYATQAGVYKIKISTYPATCHQAHSKTFSVTVKPAALTLTAPTASDITYRQALSASVRTGGTAKVGSCDVAGTWAWKYPETTPSIGDNQSFPVVFTPSENAGNYTGFETNASVDVKRAQFVFDGSGKEADDPNHVTWCYDDNWEENQKPGSEDEVLIDHNVVIRQEISVYSVTINEGDTLTIMPTGGLTVGAGGIIGATTGNLILKAETEGETKGQTGYLRISPEYTGAMPQATVEMLRIAFANAYTENKFESTGNMNWQYMGSPISNDVLLKNIVGGWIISWDEATGKWVNNKKTAKVTPFAGFANSQSANPDGAITRYKGQLVSPASYDIDLSYTATSEWTGWNLLANSFTAPIEIAKMASGFPSEEVDATIYMFSSTGEDYVEVPVGLAGKTVGGISYESTIPSMQGFFVKANTETKLTLNYSECVWGANYSSAPNKPLRAKSNEIETDDIEALYVTLSANGQQDNLHIIAMDGFEPDFENGYDAHEMPVGEFAVFAVNGDDYLSIDATNSIVGTRVGVRTGEEMTYTMTFSHINSEENWMLWDKEAGFKMLLSEDVEYTFNAAPNSEITERFQIIAADIPAIATGVDEVESEVHVQKFIKDNQLYILKDGVLYNASGAVVRR